MTQEKPGCLAALLRPFGFGKSQTGPLSEPATLPYRLRDDFLSPAEMNFFRLLRSMAGDHLLVLAKVSLSDLFFVSRPHENRGYLNKIDRKHVDFLLCDPATLRPRLAIELDDASHRRPDRQERDRFVEEVFETAGLPLVRVPVQAAYDTRELGKLFRGALQPVESRSEQIPVVESSPSPVLPPTCPKCGETMVLRTAQRGPRAGTRFFGCPNYPRCREVAPLPA